MSYRGFCGNKGASRDDIPFRVRRRSETLRTVLEQMLSNVKTVPPYDKFLHLKQTHLTTIYITERQSTQIAFFSVQTGRLEMS